jgi:post-segregation antitoxin (ccd killing protein)
MMNEIRIRKGRQTVPISVTITKEQQARLKALAKANGLNMSELTRYALLRLFKEPYIFYLMNILTISKRNINS